MFQDLDIFIRANTKTEEQFKAINNELNEHMAGMIKEKDLSKIATIVWDQYSEYMCNRDNYGER